MKPEESLVNIKKAIPGEQEQKKDKEKYSEKIEASELKKESILEKKDRLSEELQLMTDKYEQRCQENEQIHQKIGGDIDLGESASEEVFLKKAIDDIQVELQGIGNGNEKIEVGDISENNLSVAEIVKEMENLPEEEKSKIEIGGHNIGFAMEKVKAKIFSGITGLASKFTSEGGTVNKFLKALSGTYKEDADLQERKMVNANSEEGRKILKTGNRLKVASNILKVASYVGHGPAMSVASTFSRGMETAKKMRLGNEEVIEKNRIVDEDTAAEEAWGIYEQSQKNSEGKPSKIDLQRSYEKNIPKDVLDRLSKTKGENVAQSFLVKMMQKPMEFSAKRLDKKIQAVENNSKLSPEQKEAKKNNLLDTYSRALNDIDGIVSRAGEVDTIAAGLKYAEVAGKIAMGGVMAKTLYDTLENIWNKMSDIFSSLDSEKISSTIFESGNAWAGEIDITKSMDEKQLQEFKMYKEWAKSMNAEDVFTDEELADMHVLAGREDIAHETFTHKAKLRLFEEFKEEHGGKLEHPKWDYGQKKWVEDGIHNVETGEGAGLNSDQKELFEELKKDSEDSGISVTDEDIRKEILEKDQDIEAGSKLVESLPESIEDNLKINVFTSDGQEQLMEAMKKIAGQNSQEAFNQNVASIKAQIEAYSNGSVSREDTQEWLEEFNSKLKELGAKSDIIEVEKVLKLKSKIIKSSDVDSDAF